MADKNTSKTVKIGITAGVIGAAAGAAGVLLTDKRNRKKVATKLDQVKQWSDKTVAEWKTTSKEGSEKAVKLAEKAKKVTDDIKDDVTDEVKKTSRTVSNQSTKNLN